MLLLSSAALAALVAVRPRSAHACGGCFSPPETITSVESHRMVVSLSPGRSILWDQIRYTGAPEDFVWVLPVPSTEPVVAVADELLFAELEAFTAPVVVPPPLPPPDCPPLDCTDCQGGAPDGGSAAEQDASVDVYREEVVGPYQTVVIGSEDPGALVAWLGEHGYNVPESTTPIIRHYTDLGMKFVVLRLAPDQGVAAMQPVRVEYDGYMATFPLKMVTVGAYASLDLTLWVVAEQRYRPLNYSDEQIDPAELVWDFAAGRSTYNQVFRDTIDRAGGRAWITQLAQPLGDFVFQSTELDRVRADVPFPFLTRLATDMLVDHLTDDLELGPSDRGWLSSWVNAESFVNAPAQTCPTTCPCGREIEGRDEEDRSGRLAACGCAATDPGAGLWLALAVLLCFSRRRRPV
jgi:MYXO-CTERM domain-containing protein